MARFDLFDAEWSIIAPLLPNKPRSVARVDDRRVMDCIFYVLRTRSPRHDLRSSRATRLNPSMDARL